MSAFVGWALREPRAIDLPRLRGAWTRGDTSTATGLPENQGLLWNRTRDPLSVSVQERGWAVIDGRPRWLDRQFAEHAERSGHASAALAAFQELGADFVAGLAGSYAVAIVDRHSASTMLAVDRFGIRPLAFHAVGDDIVFGSAAESVRRHLAVSPSIDPQSVYDYFFFHVIPSPRTIYRNISKLEPGQIVIHTGKGMQRRYHWTPSLTSAAATASRLNELREELPTVLQRAIARCEPQPGFGAYLSGGLDSSAVSGCLSKALSGPTPVYCVGFDQAGYDEMDYARIAAKHFGLALREIYATPNDVAQVFGMLAASHDEPFGNASAVPAYLCARRAADEGVNVLLAGDGGDELFGGNTRYVRQTIFEHYWRIPRWWRHRIIEPLFKQSDWSLSVPLMRKVAAYVRQASMPMPDRTQSYNIIHRTGPAAVFEAAFLNEVDTGAPFESLRSRYDAARTDSLLGKTLYLDWKFTLADNDLRKVTGSAELAGVSALYPMLDEDVVDLSIEIPDDQKIVGQDLRTFYKGALSTFLPKEVLTKKKHGFGLPIGEWLNKSPPLRTMVFDSIATLRQKKLLRREFIDNLMKQHREDHAAYYGGTIWVLAMFSRWLAEHDVAL